MPISVGFLADSGQPAAVAIREDVPAAEPVDPAVLSELERLMTVERLYRREGLTIGDLAAKLGLPEHRLRRTINRGLGFRNFSEYLNRHRLADAKQALADPAQRGRPHPHHRPGCRLPVPFPVQSGLQGRHRHDPHRVPPPGGGVRRRLTLVDFEIGNAISGRKRLIFESAAMCQGDIPASSSSPRRRASR